MISAAMAIAAVRGARSDRAEEAQVARLARAYALLLDTIAFAFLSLIINGVFGVAQPTSSFSSVTSVPWAVLALAAVAYFAVPEALFGATPGKYWARVRVVRVDGGPLSLTSVVVRNVMRLVDSLPVLYLLGGASVLFTANSQRLGDMLAGTTVVYRHRAVGATRSSTPRAKRYAGLALIALVIFTIAFDYFGRPALVIEGMFNTHEFYIREATSYSLGQPSWSFGSVTYPVTTRGSTSAADCTGTVTLTWSLIGWTNNSGAFECSS